ncbi:MAG: hypothetical protein WC451_02085 [Patescibacteria group bacterium]|jgi:hypothetical protein
MKFSSNQFEKIKNEATDFYNKLEKVKCPYFPNDQIFFNRKGLDHLKFKAWNRSRLPEDQFMRFKLLKYAPEVIRKSHTLQEICERKNPERIKINSRWEKRVKKVSYYGFVAIIDEIRTKVIIKEISGGEKYFWSIIPCWKQSKSIINKKILHIGNLEED